MTASSAAKTERLAVRMSAREKSTIEHAAAALGRSISEFSVAALTERAEEVLSDRRVYSVSPAAWNEFQARLDAPARPVAELVALLRRPSVFDE
ncbi:DUF1778 domain-containing protein [Cryobacterium fucosi]|uniref:DUF1778 domain-containing protein n=1 Tax=Cryobacterium fucosi TaxID=1259157 RepID=A0A4R9AW91_9MICO|nr:DUF1778 domain-containing protein [Cryobacterium fucosi]TFD70514.1 DUF1778 domain-containing protein [Cryobacterium fucosi]